jgi:hypothetical protein
MIGRYSLAAAKDRSIMLMLTQQRRKVAEEIAREITGSGHRHDCDALLCDARGRATQRAADAAIARRVGKWKDST